MDEDCEKPLLNEGCKYIDKSEKRGGKYYYRIAAIDKTGKEIVKEFVEIRTLGRQEMETILGSKHSGQLEIPVEVSAPTKVVLELFDIKRRHYNRFFSLKIHSEVGLYILNRKLYIQTYQ